MQNMIRASQNVLSITLNCELKIANPIHSQCHYISLNLKIKYGNGSIFGKYSTKKTNYLN